MVRDAKALSPDEAVAAAKERLRASARQAGEEIGQAVDTAQGRVMETVEGVQRRVHDTLEDAQRRVRDTAEGLGHTAQETVAGVQGRLHDSAHRVSEGLNRPMQAVRERPLEALAVAAAAGLLLGLLTSRPRTERPHKTKFAGARQEPAGHAGPRTQHGRNLHQGGPAAQHGGLQNSPLVSGLLATGLGKMVWDTLREEYLTPQNVRSFVNGLLRPQRHDHRP